MDKEVIIFEDKAFLKTLTSWQQTASLDWSKEILEVLTRERLSKRRNLVFLMRN